MTAIPPAFPPPGFIHVDLDGLWTLPGCYGYPEGDAFENDPIFTLALPRMLALFDELGVKATFFIIGRDTESPAKAEAIAGLARRGHELASHSWSHRFGLEDLSGAELLSEIERTSAVIEMLGGARPLGFRAPGYTAGPRVLSALSRAGIRYDGSRLPTRAAPLLRFMAGRLRAQVRRELGPAALPPDPGLKRQYGGGISLEPEWFTPEGGGPKVLRLPLAVSPTLRLPLHASLAQVFGARFALTGLRRLARRGDPVTWLLHGMDFLGAEDLAGRLPRALAQTGPFQVGLEKKQAFVKEVLAGLKQLTHLQLTRDWLERAGRPA